ncbi:VOC family protein [Variovorax paradoxus]|uniref:VOC family protein n=1 Tax=Variovorax paradoxus TaxID=34073 RepID=UPI002783BB3C|nr:VOC family protein [Variovorax paradoxus]MDP9932766.1 catechol 2,3-dioxygenase-like lactoylglutathione lyase family enzyme [Variovorax paradoxus]
MNTQTLVGALVIATAFLSGTVQASQNKLPGVRGLDHVGFTVPDIVQAVNFFQDVLGCQKATSFGPIADPQGNLMQDLLDVHPRAEIKEIVLMRCGEGSNIELFQYSAPDQKSERPRNSDHAGYHVAFYVTDLKAAVDRARAQGVKTLLGPFAINEGPTAGQAITYIFTPWGMQLELISYPKGMAYEKNSKVKLWAPRR